MEQVCTAQRIGISGGVFFVLCVLNLDGNNIAVAYVDARDSVIPFALTEHMRSVFLRFVGCGVCRCTRLSAGRFYSVRFLLLEGIDIVQQPEQVGIGIEL